MDNSNQFEGRKLYSPSMRENIKGLSWRLLISNCYQRITPPAHCAYFQELRSARIQF